MVNNITTQFIKKKHVIILTLLFGVLIAILGYFYYKNEVDTAREKKGEELKAIAELKINQISEWYLDELADAELLSQNNNLFNSIKKYLSTNLEADKKSLKELIVQIDKEHDYKDIIIASTSGVLLCATTDSLIILDTILTKYIKQAVNERDVVCTDIYRCSVHNELQMDFVSPVFDNSKSIIAVIIFRHDPNTFLYPLIWYWPTPSRTSETLLLRREGDSVLFLNELRHRNNTALKLRLPLTREEVPAVQAAKEHFGLFDGIDYRGVKVFSYTALITGTPWYMVAKVDKDELFAELRREAIIVVLFSALSILLVGLGLAFMYSYRQRNIYRKLMETQGEFRTTLYSIGDAVITTDKLGFIQHMNPVAESLTGWKESEAAGKPLEIVFKIINEETRRSVENPVAKVLNEGVVVGLANHTLLISKEGKEIPIADSGAPIKDLNENIVGVVLVFRDQTLERAQIKALQSSEEKFRNVFESANVGKSITYPTGEINVNNAFCEILGYTAEELKNKKWQEITPIEDHEVSQKNIDLLISGKQDTTRFVKRYLHKNGSYIWADVSTKLVRDENNKPFYFITTIVDVTEQVKAEDALSEKEEQFRAITDQAAEAIFIHDLEGKLIEVNRKACQNLGYTRDELIGKTIGEVDPEAILKGMDQIWDKIINGEEITFESQHKHKDGSYIPVEITLGSVHWRNQKAIVAVVRDITERKQAEERLKAYREIFNSTNEAIFIDDATTGKMIDVNDAMLKMYGYDSKEEVLAGNIGDLSANEPPYTEEEAQRRIRLAIKEGSQTFEWWARKKNGEKFWTEVSLRNSTIGGKGRVLAVVRDITERKRFEKALEEEKNFNETIIQSSPVYFVAISKDGKTIMMNKKMLDSLGYTLEEVKDMDYLNTFIPEDEREDLSKVFEELILKNEITQNENRIITKGGKLLDVLWYGVPIKKENKLDYFIGVGIDITENKKLELSLKESEVKFSSLFNTMNEGFALHQVIYDANKQPVDYLIIDANPSFEKHTGISLLDVRNKFGSDVFKMAPPPYLELYSNVAHTGKSNNFEVYFEPLKKYFEISVFSPKKGWFATVFSDITERKITEEKILKINDELEQKVKEKTKELHERVAELERFHDATITRELRMKELRDEIKMLKDKLDQR